MLRCLRSMLIAVTAAGLAAVPCGGVAQDSGEVSVRVADGFDFPVGKPDAQGFYKSRGFRANGHLGDDWNGGPGDSDLGMPVYSIGHGVVVIARDVRMGWGNTVIIRHAYVESGSIHYIDSLYAHLDRILVQEGAPVTRGMQIGTIGNCNGMYDAHLHLEIRKEIHLGLQRSEYPQDQRCYWDPTRFIQTHRQLPATPSRTTVALHTYSPNVLASAPAPAGANGRRALRFNSPSSVSSAPAPKKSFKVNPYEGWEF